MARRRPVATINTPGGPVATGQSSQPTTVRFRPFTPYKPPPIPQGTYDPALDAARRAASRGLGDVKADAERDTLRDTVDYGLGRDQIQRAQDRGTFDLTTNLNRGDEDITRQVQGLTRSYQQLQSRQGQQINAAGLSGGAALQAAAKRAANQAIDMQPLDTARQRLHQDVFLQGTRLNQDSDLQRGQLALELAPADPATGSLGGRRAQDRATGVTRAEREDTQFGIDTTGQKAFQAAGMDYVAPGRGEKGGIPRGEHVGPKGNPYRVVVRGGVEYRVRPDGSVATKRRVKR